MTLNRVILNIVIKFESYILVDLTICPNSILLSNGFVDVLGIYVGDVAIATCIIGHVFEEGGRQRTLACLSSGRWSILPRGCVGRALYLYYDVYLAERIHWSQWSVIIIDMQRIRACSE